MAHKRSLAPGTEITKAVDDLKQIKGIGPNFERQLNDAGIFTYDQLASHTTDEIAVLISGLSDEQIKKQDWIRQARKLVSKRQAGSPRKSKHPRDLPPPGGRQHYATFTVELLLDEENTVRRLRVAHIQSGEEDAWAGWQGMQLINFFKKRAGLRLLENEPTSEAVEPKKRPRKYTIAPLKGTFHINNLSVFPLNSKTPVNGLPQGQSFTIQLVLDLSQIAPFDGKMLEYKATIFADPVRGPRQLMNEDYGTLYVSASATITLAAINLPPDIYRMEAAVILTPFGADYAPQSGILAFMESGPLEVY